MAEEQYGQAVAQPPAGPGAQSGESHGITTKKYFSIAVILGVVTAMEVAIFYIEALRPMLVPLLLGLSFVKFVLVVMYFMHLRFDKAIFGVLLGAGMVMALGTFVAVGFIIR